MAAGGSGGIYGLGQWATGSLFTGMPVSKTRREEILASDKYMPIINTSLPAPADGKVATMTDTMPTRSSPTTATTERFFAWS